jgi:hypothetical protein
LLFLPAVTTPKTPFFIVTAVKTSNLTRKQLAMGLDKSVILNPSDTQAAQDSFMCCAVKVEDIYGPLFVPRTPA